MQKIPVIINNFQLLTFPRAMVEWLRKLPDAKIIILDNASTFPPLLDWYASLQGSDVTVVRLKENMGKHAPWKCGLVDEVTKDPPFYVVTDPDLDLSGVPMDVLDVLKAAFGTHHICKAGLSLRLDDIPADSLVGNEAKHWEAQWWKTSVDDHFFSAAIDTTFAMYHRNQTDGGQLRAKPPYMARHLPWYFIGGNLPAEPISVETKGGKIDKVVLHRPIPAAVGSVIVVMDEAGSRGELATVKPVILNGVLAATVIQDAGRGYGEHPNAFLCQPEDSYLPDKAIELTDEYRYYLSTASSVSDWGNKMKRLWKDREEGLGGRYVTFTFDDGDVQTALEAHRIMEPEHATFYIVPGWLNGKGQETMDEPNRAVNHGVDQDWRALSYWGHDLGSHTMNHCRPDAPNAQAEYADSLEYIKRFGVGPFSLSFPFHVRGPVDAPYDSIRCGNSVHWNKLDVPLREVGSWTIYPEKLDEIIAELRDVVPVDAWVVMVFHGLNGRLCHPSWGGNDFMRLLGVCRTLGYRVRSMAEMTTIRGAK